MTRRDERWAVPIGNDEYVHSLEDEFFRLREVERTLQATVDFLRSERDRLMQAVEELRVAQGLTREEVARLRKIEQAAREVWDTPGFAGAVPQATIERLRDALDMPHLTVVPDEDPS